MKRHFVIGLLFVILALVMASCGQDETPAEPEEAAEAAAPEAAEEEEAVEPAAEAAEPTEEPAAEPEVTDWRDLPLWDSVSGEIVHWNQSGGVVEETWREFRMTPFEEKTGATVISEFYCCGLDRLQAQVASNDVTWDIASIGTEGQLLQAINEGLLQPIDTSIIPIDLLPERVRREYAVTNEVYASVLAWNADVFSGDNVPTNATDIFDTERFPGKRCFMQNISLGGTFEVALLADGVAPEDLYPLDVERALAKLDTIRDDIVWWKSGAESIQFILDGECDLGMTFNGRPYNAWQEGANVAVTWNNAVLNQSWLAIVNGAPNAEAAQAYLAWWIYDREGMVKTSEVVGYINPREGVVELLDEELLAWMPAGPNLDVGVWENAEYYAANSSELTERFNEWLVSGE